MVAHGSKAICRGNSIMLADLEHHAERDKNNKAAGVNPRLPMERSDGWVEITVSGA
jgi:hypothetical protein